MLPGQLTSPDARSASSSLHRGMFVPEPTMLPAPTPISLPDSLPVVRARVTLRLLDATTLPPYKGALLRGGFGFAMQRASCPPPCWGRSADCAAGALCPYRWVFETPHPPQVAQLHDLRDVPRPFVIEPPLDQRRQYAAGDALELGLTLLGHGADYLPYFVYAFEQLGRMGLGRSQARARLERVEALAPWQPVGQVLYQDGRLTGVDQPLPVVDVPLVVARAGRDMVDLQLALHTPLRIKARGEFLRRFDLPALVRALCWRLQALSLFFTDAPWQADYRPLVAQAAQVAVEQQVRWVDWERTSTRSTQPGPMNLGGIIGSVRLRDVTPALHALLLLGSLVHVGKACTFGHGRYEIAPVP